MSIFDKIFGTKASPPSRSPRDIVYDFAETLGRYKFPILDTKLLPHSKKDIYGAFHEYMQQLQGMAGHMNSGSSELEQVKALYFRVSDFQDIDPEDRELVNEINSGSRFAKFRTREGLLSGFANKQEEADFLVFSDMQYKYMAREGEEGRNA